MWIGKSSKYFSCFCHAKYHKSITPTLQCDFFFKMCIFSYGHLFLVSIFYQLTFEKNQVHIGDLTHCKQTLQLIKFYLIKNMKGNRGNWLAQFKFPFLRTSRYKNQTSWEIKIFNPPSNFAHSWALREDAQKRPF